MKPFASATYQKNNRNSGDECCLCGKSTAGLDGAIHVPVNHCRGEFVTDAEAEIMGDDVSLYPIGPECAKRWGKAFPSTTRTRLRRAGGKLISYDHRTS